MSKFKCVEAGNWYSEYECTDCKERIVISAEDLHEPWEYHPTTSCPIHGEMCGTECPRC